MSKLKNYVSAAAAGIMSLALALPAAAAPTKFDFWYGLSGDLDRVVQTMCKNFNESQKDYEVACVSQGSYDAALQNTIAA
ncbi:glycerol 3-phosphate ABC transporter, partial [Rhizobium ruizarguesonis]